MEISKNSLKSKFYCRYFGVYKEQQTVNGCDWMWAFIFAALSLPFSWITLPARFVFYGESKVSALFKRTVFGIIIQFCLFMIAAAFYQNPVLALKMSGIVIGVLVGSGIFTFSLIKMEEFKNKRKDTNKKREPSILVQAYKSFKEKHCPKIEWID